MEINFSIQKYIFGLNNQRQFCISSTTSFSPHGSLSKTIQPTQSDTGTGTQADTGALSEVCLDAVARSST